MTRADSPHDHRPRVALVTGGSEGLGRALTAELAATGWRVVTDARHPGRLEPVAALPGVTAIAGDVTDPDHRAALVAAVASAGRLDLLVHNASTLGPSPLPRLTDVRPDDLDRVWRTNVLAPLALTSALLDRLVDNAGVLLSVSSDAAVEHYDGWGAYGGSKAALDHATLTIGAENPGLTAYAVDPGDLRTRMHQDAFPGEDISDRPLPETVVPALLKLVDSGLPSGRYRASEVA